MRLLESSLTWPILDEQTLLGVVSWRSSCAARETRNAARRLTLWIEVTGPDGGTSD